MSQPQPDLSAERARLGATFAEGGRRYAELRPTYPPEAVTLGVGGSPADVADIGAAPMSRTGSATWTTARCGCPA